MNESTTQEAGRPAVAFSSGSLPGFSVVMPVYNKIATLSTSLDCLFQQVWHSFEIIAVDDGSTDGSLELLQEHARAGRLKLFQRDRPGPGGYAARNHGAKQARADWLVFFDADDTIHPDHLNYFAAAIAAHPGIELFINAYQKVDDGHYLERSENISSGVLSRTQALAAFARSDFIHMNGACIQRDRFLQLGGFPIKHYRRGGDVYFWLRVLCELEAIHYEDTVTSWWHLEHSGVTRDKRNLTHLHPCVDLLKECEPHLAWRERHQLRTAINRKVLSWAVEKKRIGLPVRPEFAALRWSGMSLRQWLHAASLLLPQSSFDWLRAHLKQPAP